MLAPRSSELRRARARVLAALALARFERLLREDLPPTFARSLREEALHLAILAGVEADDGEEASGEKQALRRGETRDQLLALLVHRATQGLEHLRRGVD